MSQLDHLVPKLEAIPGVEQVTIADASGAHLAGSEAEGAEEFAATVTYVGQTGTTIQDAMSLDDFNHVLLSGKKDKLLVYAIAEDYLGMRLSAQAIVSKVETSVASLLASVQGDED